MKDLILITAFCPTKEKEDILRKLVNFIRRYDKMFDIMVSSHSNLSSDIVEMCNLSIYDKENLLLYDDEYRPKMWYKTNKFIIHSNYVTKFATQYTVLKLTSIGLSVAKTLGYKKIHKIEYDTDLTSIIEIIENSNLLDINDIIFYTKSGNKNESMKGSIWSANIEKLPKIYFSSTKEEIINFIFSTNENRIEILIQKEFIKTKYVCKSTDTLLSNGVITDFYNFLDRETDTSIWSVPVYDDIDKKIKFFTYNHTDNNNIDVLIKFNKVVKTFKLNKNQWKLVIIGDNFEGSLNVWVENKNNLNIDFDTIDIDTFKKYNYITYKL